MADFNKILDTGNYKKGQVNVVVEIPAGSHNKIEWDPETTCFILDRVESAVFARPCNYGFIPKTIGEDGDELDVLLISDPPIATGICVRARILGVMKFIDGGEIDDKIICVPFEDPSEKSRYKTLADLSQNLLEQIKFFFTHYKDLRSSAGETTVKGFEGRDEAKRIIAAAVERWQKEQG